MPSLRRRKHDAAGQDAAAAAAARVAHGRAIGDLGHTDVVQASEPFTYGERIIRRGETFHAGHEIVQTHPHLFDVFRVENEYEER
jgi:hypothetical protein